MHLKTEDAKILSLDFKKISNIHEDVIPAAVQDIESKEVLIIGYINRLALEESLANNIVTFWSTSRNELWIKGLTSGNYLEIIETRINCEQNSVLFLVSMKGEGACHTKNKDGVYRKSCFYRKIENKTELIILK